MTQVLERPKTRTRNSKAKAPETTEVEVVATTNPEPAEATSGEPAAPETTPGAPDTETPSTDTSDETDKPDLEAWRKRLGVSRVQVGAWAQLSVSAIWRMEHGRKYTQEEYDKLVAALTKIEAQPPRVKPAKTAGPTKAIIESRVKTALLILEEAAGKKTITELRALCEQVAATLAGTAEAEDQAAGDANA